MISLDRFANELLDEIISYLPTQPDRWSAMFTCRGLYWPAARRLYRHVSISDYKARRFLKTIAESDFGYEVFVRTLVYKATSNTDVHLNHLLLRDAIPRLQNLEHISMSIRSALSPFLIYLMKKSTLLSFPFYFISDDHVSRTDPANTLHGLQKLRTLRLHGDIRLLKLVTYSKIEKLEMLEPMSDEEFAYFTSIVAFQDPSTNSVLTDLTLTFQKPRCVHVMYALIRIAECFPNLHRLALQGQTLNALDISLAMTLKPPLLPHLNQFEVNRMSMVELDDNIFEGENSLFAVQDTHITEAGRIRPGLRRVTFGRTDWQRVPGTEEWDLSFQINATQEDFEMLPENFPGRPLDWDLEYSEPMELAQLQAFHVKRLHGDS